MADRIDFPQSGQMQGASQIRKWMDIYCTLSDSGRVFSGEDGKKLSLDKTAGLIAIEFPFGGFTGERTVLKSFPGELPPENGVRGSVIMEPGSDYGKTAFFFDLSNPRVSSGDTHRLHFSTNYCGGEGSESDMTVAVK